jgi:hypothetical protein
MDPLRDAQESRDAKIAYFDKPFAIWPNAATSHIP